MQKVFSLIGNLFVKFCHLKPLLIAIVWTFLHFWKVCAAPSLIFPLHSCNTSDMQVHSRCCHDIIHAWKNLTPENSASLFPVLDFHTQKEYLHNIFRLVSGLLLQILICILSEQLCVVLPDLAGFRQFQISIQYGNVSVDTDRWIALFILFFRFKLWKTCLRLFEKILKCRIKMPKRLL